MRPLTLLAAAAALSLGAARATAQDASTQDAGAPAAGHDAALPPAIAAWADAWNAYDAAAMAAAFTPDGIYEDLAFQATFQGADAIAAWVDITAGAIPESRLDVVDAFGDGDRFAVRWTFTGTPERFADIPSTGDSFSVPVVSVFEMEGGRIARVTDVYNLADLFRQVGVDPSLWVPPPAP